MNKILFLLASGIAFCFMSCEKKVDTVFKYTKSLINETDKVLYYDIRTTEGSNSAFSYGYDSIGFYFVHYDKLTISPIFWSCHVEIPGVSMLEENLYNLTDTTFFRFNLNRTTQNAADTLYWKHITYIVAEEVNDNHFEALRFKESLLQIMEKDYTILETFKEYYK